MALTAMVVGIVAGSCRGGAPESSPTSPPAVRTPPTPSPVALPDAAATREPSPTVAASAEAADTEEPSPPAVPFEGRALVSFSDGRFAGSGDCAVCHSLLIDETGRDVSMDAHWRSTMMANAAKDPLWQAKVSSEVARNPGLREVIEDKCATCHMPMAHTQTVAEGEQVSVLEPGFLDPDHPSNASAMDGVSCALCHQIQDRELGQPSSFSGGYEIDTDTALPDRLAFGPFPEPFQNPMRMMVGFIPVEGPQTLESGLCATCHTLYTPYVDATGNVLGAFPEQTPYLEWEASAFGQRAGQGISCQKCHMPAAAGPVVISNRPPGRVLAARSPFAQHHFVGGSSFMLGVFKAYGLELGLTAGTAHLDGTLARTARRLATGTATLSFVDARVDNDSLTVVVKVASSVGHKFPTGFPSRRAWIHLTVEDAHGNVVFESGRPLPDGAIAGNDADADSARYEPHCDLIDSRDEVQVYETIMQNSDREVTYTLLRAASYAKDNRLLPQGFDKDAAGPDIAVIGTAASDGNFVGGSDQVTYVIDSPAYTGALTATAELLYQSVSYRFVADLSNERTSEVERFIGYYDALSGQPAVVSTATETIR